MARKNTRAAATAAAAEEPVVEEDDASASSVEEAVDGESDGEESSEPGDEDDGSSGDSDDGSDEAEGAGIDDSPQDHPTATTPNSGLEQCTFDAANLLACNTHQLNAAALYPPNASGATLHQEWYAAPPTIDGRSTKQMQMPIVNEALLLAKAAEGTTQLLAELWRLPGEQTDVGLMARLPSPETKLPRALPPPPPKQPTKWEQFALQRGIAPKAKRSRKAFDEATGEWKHLTGSLQSKANAGPEAWPILEVKKNDDPMADPWEKLREEKKGRARKNAEARMRNAERAGTLERGSANRMAKGAKRAEAQRALARERERASGLAAPAGVPVDVRGGAKRGKPSTQLALKATQVSTASLGRFDRQREGEPERKLGKVVHGQKRKAADGGGGSGGGGGTNKKFLQSEAQRSADILRKVMHGSASKEKERDIRKGKYARGETAHDYDYDDGLGAGTYKKKKGRAGAGKMRKVTKKRMK
ncbi:hypothetical protein ACHAXT_004269 [Thalassiosira profunda]